MMVKCAWNRCCVAADWFCPASQLDIGVSGLAAPEPPPAPAPSPQPGVSV